MPTSDAERKCSRKRISTRDWNTDIIFTNAKGSTIFMIFIFAANPNRSERTRDLPVSYLYKYNTGKISIKSSDAERIKMERIDLEVFRIMIVPAKRISEDAMLKRAAW